jgi:hypothetical protein
MNTCRNTRFLHDRRGFLQETAAGFGWLALTALHAAQSRGEGARYHSPLAPKKPHFAPRAKRVIFLFANGGPSHLETFDYKPELARVGSSAQRGKYLPPQFAFRPAGKSGLLISEAFPHLAGQADELCILNGMRMSNPGHHQAVVSLHTGSENFVRPSMGAWIIYGLGTLADDLPGFVTINPISDLGGAMNYGSAFLPATFQGTRMGAGQGGVPDLINRRLSGDDQRRQLDLVERANRRLLAKDPGNPELEGLIESYELAYKMQTSVPDTLDLSQESNHIRDLYGLDESATSAFGTQCLMARRLAEKGVRFIQLTSNGWDHHNNVRDGIMRNATAIDKPIAGLIADLKQRGMLPETLLVWGGEFGRGPHEDNPGGRGHNNKGCTMWMAGGGVKQGFRYGATDEMGGTSVEGVIGVHDLHATILHLLGLDHEQLTFRYAGRDFRLTDTSGTVAQAILV